MDSTKRKAFANNKPRSSQAPVAKRPRGVEYDDDNEEGFESQLVDFEEEPEILEDDSQPTADETECPDTIVTSSKWCRPAAAKIDAKCDPLIFQQFDLDFFAGKRLQQKPEEAVLFFQQDSSILRPDTSTVNCSLRSIVCMASGGNPSPSAARINQPCQPADLADEDLAAIFKHLPPHARLLVSGVCRRWYQVSRKAWLDIRHLDFNPIPDKNIGAIVRQCPNLRSVYASHKQFGLNTLHVLPEASALSLVRLYDCKVAVSSDGCSTHGPRAHVLQAHFCRNLFALPAIRDAPWQDLVLDRIDFVCDSASPITSADRRSFLLLPASLKRLQLSGLCLQRGDQWGVLGLHRQPHLECLVLHGLQRFTSPHTGISQMVNLNEIFLGPVPYDYHLDLLASNLPLLEILFLSDIGLSAAENLSDFMTKPSLRILAFAGGFDHAGIPIDLPARKRFPNGVGGPELPLLSIFVGLEASEQLRFAHSTAATFSPITEPMPQFLEREEIAPIFKDVWIAAQIKETARNGGELWNHAMHDRAVSVNVQQQ